MLAGKSLAQSRWFWCVPLLCSVVGAVRIATVLPEGTAANDFAVYYVSSRLLLEGEAPYQTPLEPGYETFGFQYDPRIATATNPPLLLWIFGAFALLPPRGAFLAWTLVQALSLAAMLGLVWVLLRDRLTRRGWALLAGVVLASTPVYWHFRFSQVQLQLTAVVLFAFWLQTVGRERSAAVAIAVAGMIKLFPFVLLPWFLWHGEGGWRGRLERTLVVSLFGLVAVLLTGAGLWREYVRFGIPAMAPGAVNQTFNFSVASWVWNLGFAVYGFQPPEEVARLLWRAGTLAGLAVIGLSYLACMLGVPDRQRQFSLLCVAMIAGSAMAWGHYFPLLVYPCTVCALSAAERRCLPRITLTICTLIVLATASAGRAPGLADYPVASILVAYLPLYAMLSLAGMLATDLVVRQPNAPGSPALVATCVTAR